MHKLIVKLNEYNNLKKRWNKFLLYFSYHLSLLLKRSIILGKPTSIAIEPTNICNLQCVECPTGMGMITRKKGTIPFELFTKAIDSIGEYLQTLYLFFQGEPYLNEQIFDMIRYADKKKIFTYISTNGHFINDEYARKTTESGLKQLTFSLEGADEESYQKYRKNGNFNRVIDGIKNIVKWKKTLASAHPTVVICFMILRHNEYQIIEIKKLAEQLEVDKLIFKTAQVYNYPDKEYLIPLQEKFSRYRLDKNKKYQPKNKMLNKCFHIWKSAVVTIEGN